MTILILHYNFIKKIIRIIYTMSCSQFDFTCATCTNVDINFDYKKVLTYKSGGVVVDVTGFTFVMTIKDALGGSTLLTLPIVGDAVTTGLYIPAPTTGVINMQITAADSAGITAGVYPYEFTVTDTVPHKDIFMQGLIEFTTRGF